MVCTNININGCSGDIPRFDVAVIDVSINPIVLVSDTSAHLVILDEIDITSNIFHSIFYDSSGNFALNPTLNPAVTHSDHIIPYVGINFPYRTMDNGKHFCLLDTIFENIEDDLNVCRTAFTPCTNIALHKQLMNLKTFYDLGLIRLQCYLDWPSIINAVNCEINDPHNAPDSIVVDLIISIVFATPTVGVMPTIVKLIYRTTFPIDPYYPPTAV